MREPIASGRETIRYENGEFTTFSDDIATEYPLTIVVNGKEFATIVCSPTYLRELVIGFLAAEGIIRFFTEIKQLNLDEERGFAYVELTKQLPIESKDHSTRMIGSCCGKSRQFYFKADAQTAKTIMSNVKVPAERCIQLMKDMQNASDDFNRTGGIHNAALATVDELLSVKTDIGRHNTLDKIYGEILESGIRPHDKVIVFSGRISSEVLLKLSKIGIGLLISKSAPTELALQLAEDLRITTVGFTRGNKFNIYTHPFRISDYE